MNWVAYFTYNRSHRMHIPWELGIRAEPWLHAPLARSLQRFQMGERGDGAHLKRVAAATRDQDYVTAVGLFIEEEQEHADLMARVLGGMGAPLLERHWSDNCFRLICVLS